MRQNLIIDEKNMVRLWLYEKVEGNELTDADADKALSDYVNTGKLYIAPIKDALGSGSLAIKLARDMKSWAGGRLAFVKGKYGDLVIFKGWPAGRRLITGTRYRVDNPKIVQMQIGKPGLRAAAKESARFGIVLVVSIDVLDFVLRDEATLGQLLGSLSVDIPSAILASALGYAAGAAAAGTAIGTFVCGPFLVALAVGLVVGIGLYKIDQYFDLTAKLSKAYDGSLQKLAEVWKRLGKDADRRIEQLKRNGFVHDLFGEIDDLLGSLGLGHKKPILRPTWV